MFVVDMFLKVLALVCVVDVFVLSIMGILMHRWFVFRVVCGIIASVCIAAFAAIAVS